MAKTFNLGIRVSTNADLSADRVADLIEHLLNAGLEGACETIECGEGDIETAQLATDLNIGSPELIEHVSICDVKHWEAYYLDAAPNTHQFDINDQRKSNGQAFLTVGANEGDLDDMLSVAMEVNTNPLNGVDHVPCAHVHLDSDTLAISLFKIGDRILVRPENDISLRSIQSENDGDNFAEEMYWIESTVVA